MRPPWLTAMLVIDMSWHCLLVTCHELTSLSLTPVQSSAFLLLLDVAIRDPVDPFDVCVHVLSSTKPLVTMLTGISSFVYVVMML